MEESSRCILAIVGSRDWEDFQLLWDTVNKFRKSHDVKYIVSGGCKTGADLMAEYYANWHRIPLKVFYPDDKIGNDSKFAIRNKQIADCCSHLIAFSIERSDGKLTVGTQMTVGFAYNIGRRVFSVYPSGKINRFPVIRRDS